MTSTPLGRTAGRTVLLLVAATALLLTLAPRAEAGAASDGTLDWGVRESFRNYVEGPIAAGSIETKNGATRNGDGTFRFADGTGEIDVAAATGDVAFAGTVHFSAHAGALELEISDPRVQYSGTTGTLFLDADQPVGGAVEYENVAFADLDLTGIVPQTSGEAVALSEIPATLTEDGAEAFAGFYDAGQELDPVSFAVTARTGPAAGPAGKIKPGKKTQKAKSGEIKLAKLTCGEAADCKVKKPKKAKAELTGAKAGPEKVKLEVKGPRKLAAGEKGTVIAKVGKRQAKQLDGAKAKLEVELTLTAGDESVEKTVKVRVKG